MAMRRRIAMSGAECFLISWITVWGERCFFHRGRLTDLEKRRLLQTIRTVLLAFKVRWKQTKDHPDGKETQ